MSSWKAQLKKGAAELVVLSLLSDDERHGAQILDGIGRSGGLLSSGTVYPLLTRLEREGKLISRWSIDDGVKTPRKYYGITQNGRLTLTEMRDAWLDFSSYVSSVVGGVDHVSAAARS